MIVNEAKANAARLTLMGFLSDEEAEEHDATVLCMTPEKLTALFRAVAKRTHPDMGGSAEQFAQADRAKCILEAWLAKPKATAPTHKKKDCDYCAGKGHIFTSSGRPGSAGLRRTCPKCHGSGDADYDAH